MRSSKHQTRASTDTRSLATAFIGGFRRLCPRARYDASMLPAFAHRG
jgi:hypothetical protein